MPSRYGEVLRKLRREAGRTLGEVARLLDVSPVYISDVERGNRKPFSRDRTVKIAAFFGKDPSRLIEAADRERGVIEFDIKNGSPLEARVVGELVTGLARGGISEDKLRSIQDILAEDEE